jgi:hypothetical protein
MKCHEIQPSIETFLDGECSQALSTSIGAHLSNCAACTDAVRLLETERKFYARHRERIDVLPSLWSEVLDRVGANQPEKTSATSSTLAARFAAFRVRIAELRLAPLPAAALLIVAVGLTVALTRYLPGKIVNGNLAGQTEKETAQTSKQTESKGLEPSVSTAPLPGAENTEKPPTNDQVAHARKQPRKRDPVVLVREAEEKYLAAIAILQRDASRRRVRSTRRLDCN